MKPIENHITYERKGRFLSWGDADKASHLVIALHGYGHLATYFINKFSGLDGEKYFVICPEAEHRFYLDGISGRVGASWMTKEDRFTDIENYIKFLDAVLDQISTNHSFDKTSLLGFSQGGATASRYIGYGKFKFDQFILWGSVFPPDLEQELYEAFKASKNYFVVGNQDPYYSNETIHEQQTKFNAASIQFEFVNFDGVHTIHEDTLLALLE